MYLYKSHHKHNAQIQNPSVMIKSTGGRKKGLFDFVHTEEKRKEVNLELI